MAGAVVLAAGVETWGTVGQWFSGGVSAVAVCIALGVAWRDHRRYGAERRDAEKQQARLLIIKPVVVSDSYVRVSLHNRSNEPFPAVWIPHVSASTGEQSSRWANTANESWLKGYPGFHELDAQQPWESESFSFVWPEKPEPKMSECTIHVQVEYLDARGILWSRWDRNEPIRQTGKPIGRFRLWWSGSKPGDEGDEDEDY